MTIGQTLSSAISRWMEAKDSRSLNMLARLASVSYSSVLRAAQGEGKPTQEVAVAIASVVMSEAELVEFVGKNWPALKRFVVDVSYRTNDEEFSRFLHSEEYLKLVVLASHVDGTNEKEVVEVYGKSSVPYFDDLVNSGFLIRKGSNWALEKDVGSSSLEHARQCLATFIRMCNKNNDQTKGTSAAYVGWESLTKEAANKIAALEAKFCEEAFSIIGDKNNKGDILVFFGTLFNILKGQ